MRLTFLLVLLANLVALLWYTQLRPQQNIPSTPALARDVKPLVLLKELQTTQQAAAPVRQKTDDKPLPEINIVGQSQATPKPASDPSLSCHTIGPFTNKQTSNQVRKKLNALKIKVTQREKTESEVSGYRVFVPPYKDKTTALKNAKRLAKAGVQDYFVITDGSVKNGISLGLFRDKNGAIRRMAQIRRFDFKTAMEIRHREKIIYWLDYEQRSKPLPDDLWHAIREESPQLQRLPRDCP